MLLPAVAVVLEPVVVLVLWGVVEWVGVWLRWAVGPVRVNRVGRARNAPKKTMRLCIRRNVRGLSLLLVIAGVATPQP